MSGNIIPLYRTAPAFAPLAPAAGAANGTGHCAVAPASAAPPGGGASPRPVRHAIDLVSAIGNAWLRLPLRHWTAVLALLTADGRDPASVTLGELVALLQQRKGAGHG